MARLQGIAGWNNHGVAVSQMKDLPVALFRTVKFDSNISALTIKMIDHLPAIWCFCSSPEYNEAVRRIDQTLKVTNRTLAKVPVDLDRWTKIAKDKYPNGLPRPYSDGPTHWDGRKRDGFHALVNYHKLAEGGGKGRRLLESLTHSYLGDWIRRQQDGVKRGEGGAEDRLVAAFELKKRLVAIAEGEPPFDIFVRWKPIGEQPIGWEPDINDGVRVNVRPFMAEDLAGGKKGAGVLRSKPNISWRKDRGKEPHCEQDAFPWFWREGEFLGERVNDIHLTRTDRQSARGQSHQ